MARLDGESSKELFNTLADWTHIIRHELPPVDPRP